MADHRTLTFYPPAGGPLDLIAGLRAWIAHSGKFWGAGIDVLEPFDAETHLEPISRHYQAFDPGDLGTLRQIADRCDVMMVLVAKWYTVGIQAESYHHADPPIMFWSFDPVLWGKAPGGLDEADAGLLAFARAAGAAYVMSRSGLGYEVARHRFVREGGGYKFVLPPYDPHRGHRMLWVDVCEELGGIQPTGYVEADRIPRPYGYMRYVLSGTEADVPRDGFW